ncbi:MAG TPA: hypothetical protein VFE05_15645 [Longimicrobiaceae bacterium]|jgi:hypothetical protein|nr:hypothetical protein [Longimicrobiaceae bacterium]
MRAIRFAVPALIAASACAPLTPGASSLADGPGRGGTYAAERTCRVAARPSALPAVSQLVDSAGLAAAAARLGAATRGSVLFSMRYDRTGTNVRRAVIAQSTGAALADSLQKLVFAFRKTAAPAPQEWGVRLRMDLGAAPAMTVARREVCSGGPRGAAVDALSAQLMAAPGMVALDDTEDRVVVRVHLDATGAVTDAMLMNPNLRGPVEARLLTLVRGLPFVPASEDGYPVPGEASFALRLGR